MSATAPRAFAVNGVAADFGSETLRDPSGNEIPLRPRAFAVLRHLAENPGRLVTKDELMAAVWPGIAVTDDSLVQCIGEIRRAIGDDAHAVVRTVPRRGYRLALPPGAVAPARSRRRLLALAGVTAGAAVLAVSAALAWWLVGRGDSNDASFDGPPMVALVPFINVTGDAASERLTLGVRKAQFPDLARVRDFQTVHRGSAFVYGDESADPLAVDLVLGGSVEHEGDRLRITSSLLDATTGKLLWSERWDRSDSDLLAVQTEVSEQIANRLGGRAGAILAIGRTAAHRKRPDELTAYDLYLLGTERLDLMDRAAVEMAVGLLSRSVEREPGLARAWVELAVAHERLADIGVDPDGNRHAAADAAERAVDLDPLDPRAHIVLGESLRNGNELARSKSAFDTALVLAPNAAETLTLYPGWASTFGEPERGVETVDRVVQRYPSLPTMALEPFAYASFMAGRYDAALGFFERLGTGKHSRWSWAAHAGALAALGRREEAAALVEGALAAHPELSIELIANEPGFSDAEHARFVEVMRLAGFPPCAGADALAEAAERLPECAPLAGKAP